MEHGRSMKGYFEGKVAWVTGASKGIGEALAIALASQGCHVILSARDISQLERVKSRITGVKTTILPLDLSEHGTFKETSGKAISIFGHIDILINNGGISQRSLALETSLEVDKRLMDVNYLGTVGLTKALLPHLIARPQAHILVITSLVGKFGSKYRSGYAASKHALHGFFDSLRAELHPNPTRVTIIVPGFIATDVSMNALTGDGSPQNKMDHATANGLSVDEFAMKALKAMASGKEEAWIGKKEVMAVYIKRFFPSLFSRILIKAKVT